MSWLHNWLIPTTDWIQIEISTVCNANCIYCFKTSSRDHWPNLFMSCDTFEKIIPALSKTGLAYLQGWGEPFLHPDIFTFISKAKQAGCKVGTTTNGMALDDEKIRRLIELGVDIVAFSLAGTAEKNDIFRQGTQLNTVLSIVKRFNQVKREMAVDNPSIHIAYMLLRSGLDEFDNLPSILAGLEIDQAVITTLPYAPTPLLENETFHDLDSSGWNELKERIQAVADRAKRAGISLYYYLNDPDSDNTVCTENSERALFVSVTGDISPCVFTGTSIRHDPCEPENDRSNLRQLVFGNINRTPFPKIWNQKAYRNFRNSFSSGHLSPPCLHCPKRFEILT